MGFAARLQYIFQSGVPKRDFAFYQKFTVYPKVPRNYKPIDFEEKGESLCGIWLVCVLTIYAGWTYEYINDENMFLPTAVVSDGRLAKDRQDFQALVVRANDSMTVKGVQKIVEYAHEGLPIVFSGGTPTYLASYNASGSKYILDAFKSISKLKNVHIVPYGKLSPVLAGLGIKPLTQVNADRIWYTYWRTDSKLNRDYVFVYNDAYRIPRGGGASTGTVEFLSTGKPYLYDAWSGAQTPIYNYTQTKTTTTIYMSLAGNQSAIVAFHNDEKASPHAVSTGSGIIGFSEAGSKLVAHVTSTSSVVTSEGTRYQIDGCKAEPITLKDWSLTVEHWDPPKDLFDIETVAIKHNTSYNLPKLVSWQDIPGLQNVSGRGYYKTSFEWDEGSAAGAIIDFGPIVHTIRVNINGHTVPPLDTTAARADISKYLKHGENVVEAAVATTLVNVLSPIWFDLESSAIFATNGPLGLQDYGLLYDVVVTPYTAVEL